MKSVCILFFAVFFLPFNSRSQEIDECEKVQSLLNWFEEVKAAQIKGNTYACKDVFIINGFKSCAINLFGDKQTWTVTLHGDEQSRADADSLYLDLAHSLVKCSYLNSWKVTEKPGENSSYNLTIDQTIAGNNGRLKNITINLGPVKNSSNWKVEMRLSN